MYELNSKEKTKIKLWIITARMDYFRKNKYIFKEKTIEGETLYLEGNLENTILDEYDNDISANNLENIFSETNLAKATKQLTYKEKLILSLYYIDEKKDNEIAEILFITRSAVTKKRKKAIEKLKEKYERWGR